jgi:hypothetical protein
MSKNTVKSAVETQLGMTDFESQIMAQLVGWEKVETGFPPYWKPEVGKFIAAKVCAVDARQPEFVRYILQATRMPVTCARGPVDGAEEVIVQPEEFFTMGEYASLDLTRFFDMEIFIKVTGTRKLVGNEASHGVPRKLFDFDVRCSPEDKKKLNAMRAEEMKLLSARRTIGLLGAAGETAQLALA